MFYSIRHLTQFRYDSAVRESLMELRMHPRTEGAQRCLSFDLSVDPRAQVDSYRDYLGNSVHHFDVPGKHAQLRIIAESLVEVQTADPLPQLDSDSWARLDALIAAGDYWEMVMPSQFAQPTTALARLIEDLQVHRRGDPLSFLKELNAAIYDWFDYVPKATRVDSPIDHAIEARKGVCQDFAHIMTALVRHVRIPCRYVSGYVCPSAEAADRSPQGASHAWVEALLPGIGWVGFDPTNNLITNDRHIRTAIGRDYADVPPTKGLFKGNAASELAVSVRVALSGAPPPPEMEMSKPPQWEDVPEAEPADVLQQQQQQQQQVRFPRKHA
jgi:transglutaminase-like putative cysteine protease